MAKLIRRLDTFIIVHLYQLRFQFFLYIYIRHERLIADPIFKILVSAVTLGVQVLKINLI